MGCRCTFKLQYSTRMVFLTSLFNLLGKLRSDFKFIILHNNNGINLLTTTHQDSLTLVNAV